MTSQQETMATRIAVDEPVSGDDRESTDDGRLSPSDFELVRHKRMDANRLGFAVQLARGSAAATP